MKRGDMTLILTKYIDAKTYQNNGPPQNNYSENIPSLDY